jgi:hypothetical protein
MFYTVQYYTLYAEKNRRKLSQVGREARAVSVVSGSMLRPRMLGLRLGGTDIIIGAIHSMSWKKQINTFSCDL